MEPVSQRETMATPAMTSLEGQLREMYGRAAYTHKTHEKMADGYIRRYQLVKGAEIFLSAVTAGSLLVSVFGDSKAGVIVGAVLSTVLLALTLYFKEAALGEQAQKHSVVASKLWGVREALLSLLIDMHDGRNVEDVRQTRDQLNRVLEDIYKSAPRTDSDAYAAAQRALKQEQELFFTDAELDHMLPEPLRKGQE